MGRLALAAKITHVPSMYLSEIPGPSHGGRQAAIDGHVEIGRRCRELGVDTIVVFDTHWLVNAGYHINCAPHFQGVYTSNELPHFISNMAYDHRGNPDLGVLLAKVANEVTGGTWAGAIIALGAVISIFSVVLVTMYGQTRILFAMGRDGLLPRLFTRVNPRTQTSINNTIIVAVIISILAAFVPLGQLAEATSIGTLFAFMIVNAGVISLRRSRPNMDRSFKTPLYPVTPILGVVGCLYLISSLASITWLVFALWLTLGMIIYFTYGYRRSRLARGESADWTQDPQPPVVD